jgi:hypothetical protein
MQDQLYLRFSTMSNNMKLTKLLSHAANRGYVGKHLTFAIPAGHSCPFAHDCLSKADRETGKLTDGQHTQFRCYAATQETRYRNVRSQRWHNFDLLRQAHRNGTLPNLIRASLKYAGAWDNHSLIRWHESGDFFNQKYLDAFLQVAAETPTNRYYLYTKALPFWLSARERGLIPANVNIIASAGGTHDALIEQHNLPEARVVYSHGEAEDLGYEIDHDDSHAAFGDGSFALLIHGTQPKGSTAGKAVWKLQHAA